MKPENLLCEALDIHAPWQIVRMRNDLGKGQIDIWVAQETAKTGWFFGSRTAAPVDTAHEGVWRHVNLGNARCIVHAVPPSGPSSDNLQWFGEDDQPFTRGLSRKIAGMFMEGLTFPAICSILDISVTDLWKFKHRLDSGKSGLSAPRSAAANAAEAEDSTIPSPNDPIWEKLLDGSITIDIRILSLKLLLTKLREQFSIITDGEVRILKAHEMQRYFARHEKLLGHELAQLARH